MFMHILIKQSINVNLYNIEINHFFNPKNLITFLKFFPRINIYFEKEEEKFNLENSTPQKFCNPILSFPLKTLQPMKNPFVFNQLTCKPSSM